MFSREIITIFFLSLFSGLTTLIGVSLAIWLKANKKINALGIGFAAGIMLLISFLELIPESINTAGLSQTIIAAALGVLLIAILNIIIPHTHLVKEKEEFAGRLLKTAYLVGFGLILHDVPEGFAMASSYLLSASLGSLVAVGIALHNIPEEFAMAAPIVLTKSKKFLYIAAFLSGMAEPLGAILGILLSQAYSNLIPIFMSLAAGAMIFISLHELFPLAKIYKKTPLFLWGLLFSGVVYWILKFFIPE